ncbi:carboxypeptidase-like regulatory domain-containing protein [Chloroflexota bacterium]
MYRFIAIMVIFSFLALPGVAYAQEANQGTVEGQVINGTEGGGSVAGLEITLITYVDNAVDATRAETTDSDGKFRFDNITIGYQHLVSANYMGVHYYNPVVFEVDEITAYVEVGVCDTTDSDEMIRVQLSHTIIYVEEDSIKITEMFWFVNDGDRTYTGTDGVLIFTLPEGAADFEAPQELLSDYQFLDNNRLFYLVPFPPGERQLVFSFNLAKPDSDELIIPLEINYPTDTYELMVSGEDIEVIASQMTPIEPVTTDSGEQFIHFRDESLPRGTVTDLRLSGLSESGGQFIIVLWTIIAIIIICTAIYIWKRKKVRNGNE